MKDLLLEPAMCFVTLRMFSPSLLGILMGAFIKIIEAQKLANWKVYSKQSLNILNKTVYPHYQSNELFTIPALI